MKIHSCLSKKAALARRTDTAPDSDGPASFDSTWSVPISTQRHVLFQCLCHRAADLFQHWCSDSETACSNTSGTRTRPEALSSPRSTDTPPEPASPLKSAGTQSSPIGGGLSGTVRRGRDSTPVSAAHYTRSDSAAPWSDMARRSDYMPATIERSRARPRTVRAPPEKSDADCYAAPRQH